MGCGSRCPVRPQGPRALCVDPPEAQGGPKGLIREARKVASWWAHPGRETKPRRPAAAFSLHWGRSFARLGPHRQEAQAGPHPQKVMKEPRTRSPGPEGKHRQAGG